MEAMQRQLAERVAAAELAVRAAEAERLQSLCEFAEAYAVDCDAVVEVLVERRVRIGATGTPSVSEFVTLELAGLLSCSPSAAGHRLAAALNLKHRHPQLFAAVVACRIEVARALRAATRCADLAPHLAERVTRRWLPRQRALGWAAAFTLLDKLVIEADLVLAAERERIARESRGVFVWGLHDGCLNVTGRVDVLDGRYLDASVQRMAEVLALNHPDLSIQQLRAKALGVLAHPAYALALLQQAAQPALVDHPGEGLKSLAGQRRRVDEPSPEGEPELLRPPSEASASRRGRWGGCEPETGIRPTKAAADADLAEPGGPLMCPPPVEVPHSGGVVQEEKESAAGWSDSPADLDAGSPWGQDCASQSGWGAAPRDPGWGEEPPHPTDPGERQHRDPHRVPGQLCGTIGVPISRLRPQLGIAVHLHTDELGALTGAARIERAGWITRELLADLLGDVNLTVQPVIDLPRQGTEDRYRPSAQLRRALEVAMPTEQFPFSDRRSPGLDVDHTRPYRAGKSAQTRLGNLVPLSRRVHRAKTLGAWISRQRGPDVIEWISPLQFRYEVGPDGTRRLD